MAEQLPSWPMSPPRYGPIVLRQFADDDVGMAIHLGEDPYIPLYQQPDTLRALTTFAWTIPALHRIELYIEPWSTASIRVAEAGAYRREGLLRSHQEIGGQRRDMLLYAATRTDQESPGGHSKAAGEPAGSLVQGHGVPPHRRDEDRGEQWPM